MNYVRVETNGANEQFHCYLGDAENLLSSKQNVLDAWNRIWIFKSYVLGPDSYEIFDTSNT